MTKEEYIKIRDKEEIPMEYWFEFYRERGGIISDIKKFEEIFTTFVNNNAVVTTPSGIKEITLSSCFNNLCQYYNKKFEL